jgi:pimeloyl-ACP methyl ester carboxylesterase
MKIVRSTLLFASTVAMTTVGTATAADRPPQSVTLRTGDGAELVGRYWRGPAGRKSPAVLVLDDLGAAADPKRCDAVARTLVKDGCAVLCFDFRGHGASTAVTADFWADPTNRRLVRGYHSTRPKATIGHADFRSGYLPALINDVAAGRAFLEQRNDADECNASQIIVVGFGRGATLGALWVATEWTRYRSYGGFPERWRDDPEGADVAGCVWVGLDPVLDGRPAPVLDWLNQAEAKRSVVLAWAFDGADRAAARLVERSAAAFNRGTDKISLSRKVDGLADEAAHVAHKGVAAVRDRRPAPVWTDRDFTDSRYVWVSPRGGFAVAKVQGEDVLLPVPAASLTVARSGSR